MRKVKRHVRPFIKKFRTARNFYVYDVNTNHFLQVDRVVYFIVDDIHRLSRAEIIHRWNREFARRELQRALRQIDSAVHRDNLFSEKRPTQIRPYGGEDVAERLGKAGFQQLILNVTEDCIMRCEYCLYGGKYPNQRVHSRKRMSWVTAKKALDWFLEKSTELAEANISFYGGEPLLNLALIQRCVSYIKEKSAKKYIFAMTTNGLLLRGHILDYLAENEFNVMVSLDGPRALHDRYRVDRKGNGTWDRIMTNLQCLRDKHPSFFHKHVTISTMITSERHTLELKNFFERHSLLSPLTVSSSFPVYSPNPVFDNDPAESDSARCSTCSLYRECASRLISNKRLTPFMKNLFQREFYDIYTRPIYKGFDGGVHINGCCFPGQRRVFVSSDGTYFVCERLDNAYPLGNVKIGIRPEKVLALIEDYKRDSFGCLNCWAVRLCTKCFANMCVGGEFDPAYRAVECQAFRRELEQVFILYHQVLEQNPSALRFLRNVTVS